MKMYVGVNLQLNAFLVLELEEAERLPHAWAALSPRIEDFRVIHLVMSYDRTKASSKASSSHNAI
jgi:hypothetical protein